MFVGIEDSTAERVEESRGLHAFLDLFASVMIGVGRAQIEGTPSQHPRTKRKVHFLEVDEETFIEPT